MPKIAFLPLNVSEPVRPALGRQLSHFLSEVLKVQPDVETNYVSYLAQVGSPSKPEAAFVNLADELNDAQFVEEMISQQGADFLVDGVLKKDGESFVLTMRLSKRGIVGERISDKTFTVEEIFDTIRWMVKQIASAASITLLPDFAEKLEFGTEDALAFYDFLLGFDAISYVQQAGHQVAEEFDVSLAFDSLTESVRRDSDFLGPYEAALQLSQLCAQNGVGNIDLVEGKLKALIGLVPEDWRGYYAAGDLYHGAGKLTEAAESYEKAIRVIEKEGAQEGSPSAEPILYTRLGLVQQQLNMVANAERSYKKALDMEGPEKPTMDFLAGLLAETGRAHEVPAMWRQVVEENPTSPQAWAKYAMALLQSGNEDASRKAFDEGLEKTGKDLLVKRYYAPFLFGKKEYDKAMDFYEDCIEETPNDIPLLLEYAQTLQSADRLHEVPDVLKTVLNSNPDPDTRANAQAWLYEIEQPKRFEMLQAAQDKMQSEKFQEAIGDLEPLTSWMPDYWKLWAMLATLYNRVQRFEDAENAARKAIEIFPGFEPAYGDFASSLVAQGRAEDAYNMLNMVLRARPRSWQIALNLAMAAKQTGRTDEASRLAKQLREAAGAGNVELEQVLSELERP